MASITNDPRWGEYQTARAYYASDEWLDIVRASLDAHQTCLASARRIHNAEAVAFYEHQILACQQQLGIAPAPTSALTVSQQSLFDSILKG